jgi:hypothetical protein
MQSLEVIEKGGTKIIQKIAGCRFQLVRATQGTARLLNCLSSDVFNSIVKNIHKEAGMSLKEGISDGSFRKESCFFI